VAAYDTASGDLVARRRVPADTSPLNDVCTADGFAYVTDSVADVLWRVPIGDDLGEPEPWLRLDDPAPQLYLNGIDPIHQNGLMGYLCAGGVGGGLRVRVRRSRAARPAGVPGQCASMASLPARRTTERSTAATMMASSA
jgi:hypothetical protein